MPVPYAKRRAYFARYYRRHAAKFRAKAKARYRQWKAQVFND